MANFWKLVNKVINESDIILEVLDARFAELSRNPEIERKIRQKNKKLIYVINKADLVPKALAEKIKRDLRPSIFVSTKLRHGITMLKKEILKSFRDKQLVVGVLGYPNTGKSSVINALKGKSSAPVSSQSSHTRGLQKISISKKILLIDSPGVYAYSDNDEVNLALIGSKSYHQIKDPEGVAYELVKLPEVKSFYGVDGNDELEILEDIANKLNLKKRGNVPDTARASIRIIQDWQSGKIIAHTNFL